MYPHPFLPSSILDGDSPALEKGAYSVSQIEERGRKDSLFMNESPQTEIPILRIERSKTDQERYSYLAIPSTRGTLELLTVFFNSFLVQAVFRGRSFLSFLRNSFFLK